MSGPRRLRILMLADVEPNPDSGAAGTELRLADELETLGHDVVRVWGDALPHRIRHWNLHHLVEQPRAYRDVIARLERDRPFDVLHVNQPAGWLAARRHRRRGGRGLFVHRSHGFEPRIGAAVARWLRVYGDDRRSPARRLATRALAPWQRRHYRAIAREAEAHAVSCGECADFLAGWGVPRERIHVGAQAPPDAYLAAPQPWSERRGRRILYVGQHAFFKAPRIAARVLGEVLGDEPGLEATWVTESGAHAEVTAQLAELGLAERVGLRAWMPANRLRDVYDEHGIFLFTSFAEGFGKVFVEAMARGLAVVATRQGGARDLLVDGENGLLAPVGDVAALVAQVRRLRREPGLAARLAAAGRRTAERHTWSGAARSLAGFYAERLAAKRTAP